MPTFKPDTCSCNAIFTIVDNQMIGELVTACENHTNFNSMIVDNRKKNQFIGLVYESLPEDENKTIYFSFNENHQLQYTTDGFTEEENELINTIWSSI